METFLDNDVTRASQTVMETPLGIKNLFALKKINKNLETFASNW